MDNNVIKEIQKMYRGVKYIFPLGVLAKNVETDSEHKFLTAQEIKELKEKPGSTDPVSNNTVVFENVADTRVLLQSGTKLGKLFPQINIWLKWLNGLGTAAWKGVSNSTNVTADGYVADARAVKTVNDKFGGVRFEREGDTIYAVYGTGADAVRKKLGSGGISFKNAIIHNIHRERVKNLEIVESPEWTRYGNMSVFDLTSLPGYKDFIFGENVIAMVLSMEQMQGNGFRGMVGLLPHKKLQHNIAAPIDDSVTVRNFLDPGGAYTPQFDRNDEEDYYKHISEYEPGNIKTEYIGDIEVLRNMALYCPSNGRLYCACFNTSTIIEVSLYKI